MKHKVWIALAAIACKLITGCSPMRHLNDVSQVTYTADSGPISSELQWHEEIIITRDKVRLARNGRDPNTEVNAGTWNIAADAGEVAGLFAQLEAVDCSSIERVEPESSLDGGGSVSYDIVYANEKTYFLSYDPGVTYTYGESLTDPVDAFIQGLSFPVKAVDRYRSNP